MPTYRNDSDYTLFVDGNYYGKGAVFETYKIINRPGVVKLSEEPIFPIALSETQLNATSAGEELSVDIDLERCKRIEVARLSVAIEVRANLDSSQNPYMKTVNPGEVLILEVDGEIEKLYIKFSSSGSCVVTQYA